MTLLDSNEILEASEQAGHPFHGNQWTVNRMVGEEMQTHTFSKGEKVAVSFNGKHYPGKVVGISHAIRKATIEFPKPGGTYRAQHDFGTIYKHTEPESAPKDETKNRAALDKIIDRVNKKNEPEGGWSDSDKVPVEFQSYQSKATDARRESLANRLGEIISAVHVKTYTEIRNGKSVVVHEHEDKRKKQAAPQAAPKRLSREEIKDKVKSAIETAKEKVGSALQKNEPHSDLSAVKEQSTPTQYKYVEPKVEGDLPHVEQLNSRTGKWEKAFTVRGGLEYAKQLVESRGGKLTVETAHQTTSQTDTPAFRAWFGNSKVVDKDGKPLVVYHGTTSDFSEFKRVDGGNMWGAGHYFAESAEDAGQYSTHFPNRMTPKGNAAPNVIPVFLQINNPFVMDAPLTEQTKKLVGKEIGEKIDDYSWPGMKNRDIRQMLKEQFVSSWEDANSVLEKIGFDGLVEKNATASQSGARTFMVFKPTQIKSAIGNKGTWSKTDPNITATDHSVDITEMIQAIRRERLSRRIYEIVKAAHIKTYEREIGGKMVTVHEHEDSRQKWTGGEGGIHLKRVGEGKESKWVTHEGKEIPEHAKKLVIPPAWKNVRVAPDASHDLQAIGEDAKDRVQRIYSEDATQRAANEKFSRNKELLEKQEKIFRQNEANRKNDVMSIRNHADCMKLIQETGIRPGSDADTGAEKKAYGATTLEGRHVIIEGDKVRLQFVGKKGVNLDIPVDDADTASMLKELKKAAGDNGKLFSVTDATLRDYSHTLDGGSFKPKDFRTLKGTNTAIEEIAKIKEPAKTLKDYKKMVMAIAKKVSEKLGNTPTIALQSYINPFVFESIKPA